MFKIPQTAKTFDLRVKEAFQKVLQRSELIVTKKEKIVESAVTGKPVTALCGKKWTPGRDPSKFPICPECQEIHASLPRGGD